MNCPAYTPPSAPKACPWKLRGVVRGLLCFYLALCVAFIPLDFRIVVLDLDDTPTLEVQRNEAQALVPVGAGGAAAAAAALGLTETQLACGMAVVLTAGAGLYLYYNANSDLSTWPTDQAWPGFKPWDDLTPQEKQNWVGQDGDVGDYWQQQLDLYTLNYGLWDYDQQGNPQPTPEPEDPDEKEKWFTKNNVITALGTGAAVSLGTVASTLVNDAANTLADFLFGKNDSSNTGLGLQYASTATFGNYNLNFGIVSSFTSTGRYYTCTVGATEWAVRDLDSNGYPGYTGIITTTGNDAVLTHPDTVAIGVNSGYSNGLSIPSTNKYSPTSGLNKWAIKSSQNSTGISTAYTGYVTTSTVMLNAIFSGAYNISYNGNNYQYGNGSWVGNQPTQSASYGQLQDTPNAISTNILNAPSYTSNVNNYTNVDSDNKKAVQIPTSFTGVDGAPTYSDYVKTTPNEDITEIPNDEPLPGPGPGPGPGPDNPTEYEDDFSDKVAELLAQPFDQLFPFCLIGDLRVFTEKVNSAFNGGGLNRSEPNYDELVIPLQQFNVDGLDDITFDLVPLKGMGAIVKPWINALLVVALLIGSFRFFLNRGGE